MKIRLGLISWATGALVLVAVSACGGNDADPIRRRTTPATSSSDDHAPTASASPTSPSDAARPLQASGLIRQYFAVLDELGQDPASDLKTLATVATGTQLSAVQTLLPRSAAVRVSARPATPRIAELKVQSVNLDNSDPAAGKVPTVVIDVCWDVSKVDVLDKSGKSIVSPNRPDTGWTRYTVANYDYAADPTGGWRVATGQDLKQTPCAAS